MKNVLVNMLNVKSAGQMTYMVNLLSEVAPLHDYSFIFLINEIANNRLKNSGIYIPENVRVYAVHSSYSYGATSYIWQIFNLPHIIQDIEPDYVYAPTHIAYKVPNVKTILAMRNMAIPNFLKIDVPFRMRLNLFFKYLPLRYSLRKADKVVAVSNYVRDYLIKQIGIDEKDIIVAYHIINTLHKDDSCQLERCGNIDKNDTVIFIPGSYYRYKKFHVLLNYLELVKMPANTKIVFAGDESDPKYVDCLMKHKSKVYKLSFQSSLNAEEMKFFYKVAKLVILSSQVEACPNIALEALANKSNVLACNIPPFKEILGDFATYFDVNDEYDFVKKFGTAISSIPKDGVQLEQLKKVTNINIIDVLTFCEAM